MDASAQESRDMAAFVASSHDTGDIAQSDTAGLYHLTDYKKKRSEAFEEREQKARETLDSLSSSRSSTPGDSQPRLKKRKRETTRSKLSFDVDESEEQTPETLPSTISSRQREHGKAEVASDVGQNVLEKKRAGPNLSVGVTPKILTKNALTKDAETRERLRKEFLIRQDAIKATEILVPFVFYDGTNIPGGVCKMKKGDPIWLFLDRSRKVGAELGVGGVDKSKREWARVSVEDLMCVREDIIIPHHYDFYYFTSNAIQGFQGTLFDSSPNAKSSEPNQGIHGTKTGDQSSNGTLLKGAKEEGLTDDASKTKVVDRRWYEKHKHIYPSSIWEEYDPTKDYTKGVRKDSQGNAFFFR